MNLLRNLTAGQPQRLVRPVACTMLSNLLNVVPFCLSIEAVRLLFEAFDGSGRPLDAPRLWMLVAVMAAYMLVMAVGERLAYRANFRGAYAVSAEGRLALADHLRRLSLGFLSRHDAGDLSSMLVTDFTMAETGISHHLPQLMGALVMPVLAFVGLSFVDFRMAVAMFVALPLAVAVLCLTTSLQRRLSARQLRAKIAAGTRFEEYLSGLRVMKAYGMVGERFGRLRDAFDELRRASIRLEATLGPFVLLSVALVRTGLTLMVLTGTYLVLGGELTVLTFVVFLVVGSRVFDPLTSALTNFTEFRYYAQAGGRIRQLMAQPVMAGREPAPAGGDIELDHVSFSYGAEPVLRDVSLRFPAGKLTALVGPSGSGKTTLLRLCARFYDPGAGSIRLGGQRLDRIEPESFMARVSMVFQDVYLFRDTVRANLRFGRPEATDAEVEAAARAAQCHDFISQLPRGYDTLVGEGGCTLSGGERQRISIARALLKNAPIVLLDEATASLDAENERAVQQAIDSLVRGRTVVVVAHRLSTVMNADQIVVLNEGRVEDCGRHAELMAHGGLYARLWHLQEQTAGWTV